jgi:hypothetical protein
VLTFRTRLGTCSTLPDGGTDEAETRRNYTVATLLFGFAIGEPDRGRLPHCGRYQQVAGRRTGVLLSRRTAQWEGYFAAGMIVGILVFWKARISPPAAMMKAASMVSAKAYRSMKPMCFASVIKPSRMSTLKT